MTSAAIVLFVTVSTFSIQGATAAVSYNVANLMAVLSGNYNNLAQYREDNSSFSFIQLRIVPVITSAIPQRTVLFNEWSFNGKVLNLQLADVTEDSNRKIHFALYNITNISKEYKPGEYEIENLSKLKPGDVRKSFTCWASFRPIDLAKYMGTWTSCRHQVKGKPALYDGVATCNSIEIMIPPEAAEKTSIDPYNLVREGDKYQIPGAPDGFVSPCS